MLKAFFILLTLILAASCRQGQELKYSTETLNCLQSLIENQNRGNDEETIKVLNKYSDKFKFAADLKSNFSDKLSIQNAENLAASGQVEEAKAIIENRIIERGYSDTLEISLNSLDKVLKVQNYLKLSGSFEIAERAREFAQVKAHTQEDYRKLKDYKRWIASESKNISRIAQKEKEEIIKSLRFVSDYAALNNPDLFELLLLEIADRENSFTIPGVKDDTANPTYSKIYTQGLSKTVSESYSGSGKTLKTIETRGINSLQEQLTQTHLLAKTGQISKTLESLQELQDLCGLDEKFRRRILKVLFLAKGWNDASLINRDFLDISYLLETVYKANQ